jgi:hypothetical protein
MARSAPEQHGAAQIPSPGSTRARWRAGPTAAGTPLYPMTSPEGNRTRHSSAAAAAPTSCATMKPGTWLMAIPANVVVKPRASVTAGLPNDVEDVNQ